MTVTNLLGSQTTSLYRFYDAADTLLYIGMTNCLTRRIEQHEERKPWFTRVARVTVEQYPDRETASAAEIAAIVQEKPRFNIQHNRRRQIGVASHATAPKTEGRWYFESRRSGYVRTADLVLYPELDCSAMVDDYYDRDGEEQLEEYVSYIKRHHPEWLKADAVPIIWSVHAGWQSGVFETAPFQDYARTYGEAPPWDGNEFAPWGDFLTHFTWPYDQVTGKRLDWYQLPVINDRFPDFAAALAWTPSPLQPTAPLRSILASRAGHYEPRLQRRAAG